MRRKHSPFNGKKVKYGTYSRYEKKDGGNFLKALERDGDQCAICGSCFSIVVHHLDGDRKNNRLTNLLTACKSCHADLHGQTLSIKSPRKDLILELRGQEKTFKEVGDYLGISRQRVHQIIKRIGT